MKLKRTYFFLHPADTFPVVYVHVRVLAAIGGYATSELSEAHRSDHAYDTSYEERDADGGACYLKELTDEEEEVGADVRPEAIAYEVEESEAALELLVCLELVAELSFALLLAHPMLYEGRHRDIFVVNTRQASHRA